MTVSSRGVLVACVVVLTALRDGRHQSTDRTRTPDDAPLARLGRRFAAIAAATKGRRLPPLSVSDELAAELEHVAAVECRPLAQVERIFLTQALRRWKLSKRLTCGFSPCTRRECCGGELAADPGRIRHRGGAIAEFHPKQGRT